MIQLTDIMWILWWSCAEFLTEYRLTSVSVNQYLQNIWFKYYHYIKNLMILRTCLLLWRTACLVLSIKPSALLVLTHWHVKEQEAWILSTEIWKGARLGLVDSFCCVDNMCLCVLKGLTWVAEPKQKQCCRWNNAPTQHQISAGCFALSVVIRPSFALLLFSVWIICV